MTFSFDPASVRSSDALPAAKIATSTAIGWSSALLDVHEGHYLQDEFETGATSDFTMVVALSGRWTLESFGNGAWRTYVMNAGSISFTPPQESARLRLSPAAAMTNAHRTAHLYIPRALLEEATDEYLKAGMKRSFDGLSACDVVDPIAVQAVRSLVHALEQEAPDLYAASAIEWLARHLLFANGNDLEFHASGYIRSGTDVRIARAIDFMRTGYRDEISLASMALAAGMSKFHFSRIFCSVTGMTPFAVLSRIRLEEAQRLISSTGLRVDEVSSRCGFKRLDHFTTTFRKQFGVSPSKYRKLMRL